MLVINRRIGQRVIIGEDIVLEILEVSRGRVALGFAAPRDIVIDREEVRVLKDEVPILKEQGQ